MKINIAIIALPAIAIVAACTPEVKVQAPDKPIEINLNINIEQHVKIENAVQSSIKNNPNVF